MSLCRASPPLLFPSTTSAKVFRQHCAHTRMMVVPFLNKIYVFEVVTFLAMKVSLSPCRLHAYESVSLFRRIMAADLFVGAFTNPKGTQNLTAVQDRHNYVSIRSPMSSYPFHPPSHPRARTRTFSFLPCPVFLYSKDPHGGNLLKTADKRLAYLVRVW